MQVFLEKLILLGNPHLPVFLCGANPAMSLIYGFLRKAYCSKHHRVCFADTKRYKSYFRIRIKLVLTWNLCQCESFQLTFQTNYWGMDSMNFYISQCISYQIMLQLNCLPEPLGPSFYRMQYININQLNLIYYVSLKCLKCSTWLFF